MKVLRNTVELVQSSDIVKLSAVKMYDYYGFYPIGNYCNNPSENAIFRELDLKE